MNLMVNGSSEAFEGLLARAAITAERLQRESPLRPGGRIVTALENTREHVELVIAGWRLGLQLVAAAPTVSGPTFAGILGSTAPQAVAVDAANERLCRVVHDWTPRTCMLGGVLLGYGENAVPGNPAVAGNVAPRPDSLSSDWQAWLAHLPPAVFYTSGSTSSAKGVPLAWPKILEKGKAVLGLYGAAPGERVMPILPLSHVYGLYGLMGAAALGADCIVLRESSSPSAFAAALADQGATIAVCPPVVGAFLFGRHGCEAAVRERLRVLAMGGAATSREQAARIVAALPRTRVYLSYGLAETYSTVCCNDVSVPGADFASVGPLRFGAFGEVRDPASGRALPEGEVGEFCIGGTIMEGYVGMPGEGFTADGLFRTGDLVRRDERGAYAITGRLKEMINAGGLSIFPAEIEEALKRHPAVADCGVFGERAGELEVACAAVALRDPGAPGEPQRILDELLDHCRAHLALKMVPRRIVIVPSIPRGALGKIARAELRKLCEPAAART
jgi:acyl-CoA synthetase (AMP-forming)/AMP-acid ligase II